MSNSSQGYLAATYGVPMYNLANSYQRASCEIANDNLKSQVQVRYPSGYQTCSIGMQQIINGQTELRSSSTENTRKENKSPRKQVYTVFNENNKYSSSSNELKKVRRSGLQLSKNWKGDTA